MKKIYILLIAIFLGNIVCAQNWQSVGPNCINMPSQKGNGSYSMAIDNNGTPYVFIQESYNYFTKTTVRKFDGTNWINVGNPKFSSSYISNYGSIAIDNNGNPIVAFSGNTSGYVKVMKFNGNTWDSLGTPGFSCSLTYNESFPMVIDNNGIPYIAFIDHNHLERISVKKYNGTNWVYVGNAGFTAGSVEYLSLKLNANGIPYIAYRDNANYNKTSVMKFNGNNWVYVGNAGFSDGNVFYTSITIDTSGTPFVVYKDSINNNKVTVKKYNGNSWVNLGNAGLVSYPVNYTSIVSDVSGNIFIGFRDTTNLGSSTVMKYNGNTWVTIGNAGFSGYGSQDNNLLIDNNNSLYMSLKESRFYNDGWDRNLIYSVMKFNGTQWVNIGERGIADIYNEVYSIAIDSVGNVYLAFIDNNQNQKISVKKYDGNNWTNVGIQGFSSSKADHVSIALNKSGIPYVVYREAANGEKATVKKFNGTSWVNVGNAGLANGFGAAWTQIAIDSASTPYVVFMQKGSGNYDYIAFVTKFNGSNWVNVGSSYASENSAYYTKIVIDDNTGTPYILYYTTNNMRLVVRKFNGSAWETVGNTFPLNPTANKHSIAIDNYSTPYIAYASSDSSGLTVKKFNGSNWLNVGNTSIAKTDSVDFIKLAISKSGIPYLTYTDITDKNFKKAVLKYFNGNNWVNIPTTDFSNGNITGTILAINNNNIPFLAYVSFSFAWMKKYNQCINPTNGGVISANQSICLGATPLMLSNSQNSSGFMGSQVYKWQKSTISDTSGFSDIAGAFGLTYQPSSLNVNTWFRRLASVSCSNNWIDSAAISNVIKIKVDSFPVTATAAAISGSTTVCQGQTNVAYTVPVIANASSYIWTLPSGATTTTTNTTNTIYVNYGSSAVSGNITVKGHSGCGDGGSSSLAVTVSPLPAAAATITGFDSICHGQSSVTYSIPAIANATSYMWTLPAGVTGNSTTNTITVNYDTSAVSGNISVCGVNSCGNGLSSIKAITVILPVAAAGFITGSITVCQGQDNVYYAVPAIANTTSYIWTLPTGATGSSTSNSINVNFGTSAVSGNISVRGHNSCGDGGSSSIAITVNPLPAAADTITGLSSVCPGQSSVTYSIPVIANATSYVWTKPSLSNGSSTSNTITLDFSSSFTSWNISVKGYNSCGLGVSSYKYISVIPTPNAPVISGLFDVCPGQTSVTYTTSLIPNVISYNWILPTGATGTSTTNTINVNFSSSAVTGFIRVYCINSCGNSGNQGYKVIYVTPTPDAAGSISGATVVCPNQTSVIYTVPAIVNATSYIWTLPAGATGNSTTNTITVNYGTSAAAGNITVKGSNACGIGDSSILAVTVNVQPGAAGIISGITSVCQGQTSITYTTPAIANATSYIWTLPTGATGNSSTNTITVNYGYSAVSGNITVKGNNSCGVGAISSLPISVNPLPSSASLITGTTNVTAAQQNVQYSIPAIANATSYLWLLPNGATGTSTTNTITVNYSSSAVSGNITVKGINSCGIGDSSSLYITVNPFIPNCSAQFDLVADTAVLHHYFAVNNASGVPPLQYNWSWGDGNHDTTAYPSHTYSAAGYYKICLSITDSVGCTVTYCDSSYLQKDPNAIISIQVIPQGTLGINNLLFDKIKIYPNPAKNNLIIELAKDKTLQNTTISIYNIQGQLLLSENIKQSQTILNIAEFAKGIYLIKVRNDSETLQGKFVKE